ncbi:MAG: hypothetical protein ACP5VP_12235 [Candidatus Limnocylindrales bacterium]
MAKKTVPFTEASIGKLPNDKPVVYKILTGGGRNNYAGVAKQSRVQDRLREHLPGGQDPIPGKKIQIEQMPSIKDAKAKEGRVIKWSRPPYNQRGK